MTPASLIQFLQQTDTCTVANAIEFLKLRPRSDGFVRSDAHCLFPELPPVAGYAVTGRIRTSSPPIADILYYHRKDFWQYVASLPSPKILVMEDVDRNPGVGALVGEIHTSIGKALGCMAYLTNGSVRDAPQIQAAGFQVFARGLSVSHAYAHIIEFGEPVEIGKLKIAPGDLLHGDLHGIQCVPSHVAGRLAHVVREIREREAELIRLCQSRDFSLSKLDEMIDKSAEWNQKLDQH